jgi:hypothetical protein
MAILHLHNGDSSAGTAGNANIPGRHLAWREALVCGPAPGLVSDEEFQQTRAAHLAQAYGVEFEKAQSELHEQHLALSRFPEHDEVVLWFEHDLFCQVQLIYLLNWLLNWFAKREPVKTRLSLICIDRFPGITDFRGLGQLNEAQLESLFPTRRQITSEQLTLGSKAWRAYSSPDPTEIESLRQSDTSALPFLSSALMKHLQRFPSTRDGLGRIASTALELIETGQGEFRKLFPEFGQREPSYGFGDAQFFLEMRRLAEVANPLLVFENGHKPGAMNGPELLKTSFKLTDAGRAVLQGDEDFVRLNGIDQWLGGVHLNGKQATWRWDESQRKLAKTS